MITYEEMKQAVLDYCSSFNHECLGCPLNSIHSCIDNTSYAHIARLYYTLLDLGEIDDPFDRNDISEDTEETEKALANLEDTLSQTVIFHDRDLEKEADDRPVRIAVYSSDDLNQLMKDVNAFLVAVDLVDIKYIPMSFPVGYSEAGLPNNFNIYDRLLVLYKRKK